MDDEQRWNAVATRTDPAEAGMAPFLYAVVTTGVVCRPGCASRLPSRDNVRFFATLVAAEAAGFRPCRRCRPAEPVAAADATRERVVRVCRALVEHGGPRPAVELEQVAGCGSRQLARDFATVLGVSPRRFGQAVRTGRARALLRAHEQILDAVFGAGYGSVRGFYASTAPTLGMPPSAYARGGRGQLLRWTAVDTNMGTMLAVAGDLGLTAVRIGSDGDEQLADVRADLPDAEFVRADDELAETAAALLALARGHRSAGDLPVDVGGTAFQARVWSALRRIPAGTTRTYAEVAEAIGAPKAARAVAGACAANRAALVIPCHRVVRSDGALGGYRWGLSVKQQLLDAEGAQVPA